MNPIKSMPAARQLGIPYHSTISLLRSGQVPPPQRDSSGHFLWSDSDLEKVRAVLLARQQKRQKAINGILS